MFNLHLSNLINVCVTIQTEKLRGAYEVDNDRLKSFSFAKTMKVTLSQVWAIFLMIGFKVFTYINKQHKISLF